MFNLFGYTTKDIVDGIKNRDIKVFKYLDKKFRKIVIAHVRKNNSNNPQQDGDDLYNEAIIEIIRVVDSKENTYFTNFGGFFYSVYQRKWIKILNKRKESPPLKYDWWDIPVEEDINKEYLKFLYSYISLLKSITCQEILDLTIKGYNQKEIAKELKMSHSAVRKQKGRCVKTLEKLIRDDRK
ncbi:MAG: RNA polymerase sigma factor [Chitinophagales bacterium]